ncbi:unnamed protein product [Symbiodinium natans]|uniref:Uncharacterized protein n=1 Tax=Symbiodinium natans TaxID=878477 RepID=A0A812IEY5_9DINO|nr:unnamed protein product [Symbiodinium natans]
MKAVNQPFVRSSIMLQNPGEELAKKTFPNMAMLRHLAATKGISSWFTGLDAAILKTASNVVEVRNAATVAMLVTLVSFAFVCGALAGDEAERPALRGTKETKETWQGRDKEDKDYKEGWHDHEIRPWAREEEHRPTRWVPSWGPPFENTCADLCDSCEVCVGGVCTGGPCYKFDECHGACDSCQTCVNGMCTGLSCTAQCAGCNVGVVMCPEGQTAIPGSCTNGICLQGSCV